MSYLLDTDTCIYWLNGRPSVMDKLLAAGWDQVAVSVITQADPTRSGVQHSIG